MQFSWTATGVCAILLDLNKGVVQYFGLKQGCGAIFWLKQECGAILLDLSKGVAQYIWLEQGCGAIHLA